MEIKTKIPTFFAKYRIIKTNNKFVAQAKGRSGWLSLDDTLFGWCGLEMKYTAVDTVEEALKRIENYKQKVVWSGR